ncbi:DUF7344 domain-containing protein [Haloglomus salinum]|jgi:hypothetical protein|uniref:DUF7344 domain-containing protein n=1 Tax=Haloglomus salinum TaxID=2962673 RepID=UPI0020C9A3EE|nr:hypothetical protein [Haloglomus salinum]
MKVLPTYNNGIDRGEVHEILRNDRRRATVEVLRAKLGSVSLRNLSEAIAEREAGESPPPRKVRQSVYNSLHQTHLPKLDERGVIEYDRDRKTVQLEEGARHVYVHMEVVNEYGITWADYYRSLGVLALMTVVAAGLGTPFLSSVEPMLIASVFLVLFALSTARQLWVNRWLYLRALLPDE